MFYNQESWEKKYGHKTAERIAEWFKRKLDDNGKEPYPYSDNFRVALTSDKNEMIEYEESIRKGCCGFFDTVEVLDGKVFRLGFNYGH